MTEWQVAMSFDGTTLPSVQKPDFEMPQGSPISPILTSLDLLPLPSAFGRALAPTAECRRTEAFLHPQATNQQTFMPAPRRQQQQLP